jgi:hypothetical protein
MAFLLKKWRSAVDAFVEKRVIASMNKRNRQEELDVVKLAWVSHYYNKHKAQLAKMAVDPDYQYQVSL